MWNSSNPDTIGHKVCPASLERRHMETHVPLLEPLCIHFVMCVYMEIHVHSTLAKKVHIGKKER